MSRSVNGIGMGVKAVSRGTGFEEEASRAVVA
jgi:hypothetical protein